jgi:hypothetical protein
MAVDNKIKDYNDRIDEWQMMRDCARGATAVAGRGKAYLPMPSGFGTQEDRGVAMYGAYAMRAQFPDILAPTLRGMVGVIHRVEAQIEGLEEGKPLSYLWEAATLDGLPLEALHRRITGEVLQMGRYGLLTDVSAEGGQPYLAGYSAESLINWSEQRDFFVLDESGLKREKFDWRDFKRYRVLELIEGKYTAEIYDGQGAEAPQGAFEPSIAGGKKLEEIPFVVIGPRDLAVRPDEPPLIGVARASLALYRLDADYRHQLFSTGQETFVVINGDAPSAVGSGVIITLKGEQSVTPDAKYVSPTGKGIEAHRLAIQDERDNAVASGSSLFDNEQGQGESGEARKLRLGAQRATLTSVALASAAGLERALRYAAMFVGQNPDEIIVKPNLQFVEQVMNPLDAANLVKVWQAGAISKQTLYENLQRGEVASSERTFEEEEELIAADQEGMEPVAEVDIDPATGQPIDENSPPIAA